MSASSDAVTWVLQCLKEMAEFDISDITVVMSDLGKSSASSIISYRKTIILTDMFFLFCHRCY